MIDFTGEVCTNCSLNENNVFSKAEIQKLFKPYVLVKLYCDTVPLRYYAPEDRAARQVLARDGSHDFTRSARRIWNGMIEPPRDDGLAKRRSGGGGISRGVIG